MIDSPAQAFLDGFLAFKLREEKRAQAQCCGRIFSQLP